MERKMIIANGGNSMHLPDHTLECIVSAYTAGADYEYVNVQFTKDSIPVLFRYEDLSEISTESGKISDKTITELKAMSFGSKFRVGKDYPWSGITNRRGNIRMPKAKIAKLEETLIAIGRFTGWFIELKSPNLEKWKTEIASVISMINRFGIDNAIIVISDVSQYHALRENENAYPIAFVVRDRLPLREDILFCTDNDISYLIVQDCDELEGFLKQYSKSIKIIVNTEKYEDKYECFGIMSKSVIKLSDLIRGRCEVFRDEFNGDKIDRDKWISGISSGHEVMGSILSKRLGAETLGRGMQALVDEIYDGRTSFEARVYQNNALVVDIDRGRRYASAGVVSIISVPNPFQLSVDFTFDNPQVANMMVLAVTNNTVFDRFHVEGVVENPRDWMENPVFDTHGTAPYVSMEREEYDGFRIMHNDGIAGIFEWYGNVYCPDIGDQNSRKGRFMLERREHIFFGYYQDEKNDDWVGVGYVECASMNDRVFVRLGSKHYPKSVARDPVYENHTTYRNFAASTWRR